MPSNKKLIQACKLWDKVTAKAYTGKYKVPEQIDRWQGVYYSDEDYGALGCRIDGNKAEIQVGSSEGHRTKVDLDNKTLEYHDWRKENNWTIWLILTEAGLKCKRDDMGVHCKDVKPAQINIAFKAFAMPTSMDFRRDSCRSHDHSLEECRQAELQFFNNGLRKEKS